MDTDAVLDCISDSYGDEVGNTKDSIAAVLPKLFAMFKGLFVHITEFETVFREGDLAVVSVTGAIIFTQKDDTRMRIKLDEPMKVHFKKESGGWKLIAIENPGEDFSNLPNMIL